MRKAVSCEAEALRAAFAAAEPQPESQETAQALKALAPQLGSAACRLGDQRRERRSVRLQAIGLAGCSVLFLVLAYIGCHYWKLLLVTPMRWGVALGVAVVSLLLVVCMPVLMKRKESVQ